MGLGHFQQRSAVSRPGALLRIAPVVPMPHPRYQTGQGRAGPGERVVLSVCRVYGHAGHYPVAGLQMNPYPVQLSDNSTQIAR